MGKKGKSILAKCFIRCNIPPAIIDGNFLTFISQNQVNELQINKNGEWIDANISPNSYDVLSGDSFKAPKELVDEEHPLLFKPYEILGLFEFGTSQTGYTDPNDLFKAYCGV
ncbi:hypothetical protein H5410_006257 [Solanum commersonii]|uniref:Isopenicillin N synthase-like Fe(2+) 2OG dioxygenase domain-containing protein n=1 Tax=Solanum commersonii TaxID=4109 RepID=A0A9J6AAS9_SOLCO|nr:hypothetical protein H5410_006257 [Solanum commersonii]